MNAVEPIAADQTRSAQTDCLNCGAALGGRYCASCGQKSQVHRSLRSFFGDLIAGLFNFDGKFWRTLPMLAWCPGDLTRRYVGGQRARFISPIALYLFTVFLMFATLGLSGALGDVRFDGSLENTIKAEQAELQRLEQQQGRTPAGSPQARRMAKDIEETRSGLADLRRIERGEAPTVIANGQNAPPWLAQALVRAAKDPRGTMTKVQEAASTYSWLLIPLSVPVLRLLFPLRRRSLFDHTVFVTYSLSFMMLLVIAGGLMALVGLGDFIPWLLLLPPWHMYRQLKGAYGLSRGGALVRTSLLLCASVAVLTVWILAVVAIGALT